MFSLFCLLSFAMFCLPAVVVAKQRKSKIVLGFQRIPRNRVHYSAAVNYRTKPAPHAPTGKNGRKSVYTIFADRLRDGLEVWESHYPAIGATVENILEIAPKRIKEILKQELSADIDVIGVQGHCRWLDMEALGVAADATIPMTVKYYASWQEIIADLGADNEGDKDTYQKTSKLERWNLVYRAMEAGMTFANRTDLRVKLGFGNGAQQDCMALLCLANAIGVESFNDRANTIPEKETATKVYVPNGYIPVTRVRNSEVTGPGNPETDTPRGCLFDLYKAMDNPGDDYDDILVESAETAEQYIASLFGTTNRSPKSAGDKDWSSYVTQLPAGSFGRELAKAVRAGADSLSKFMLTHASLMRTKLSALEPKAQEPVAATTKRAASGKVAGKRRTAKRAVK